MLALAKQLRGTWGKLERSVVSIYVKQDPQQIKTENPAKLRTFSSCSVAQLFNLF